MNKFYLGVYGLISCLAMISCVDMKQLQYLQGNIDSLQFSKIKFEEPRIRRGDLLSIIIYSENQMASSLYNQTTTHTALPATSQSSVISTTPVTTVPGYLVDENGKIQLLGVGPVNAEGKTKKQLAEEIAGIFSERNLLKGPHVEIRFLNLKITLMGEVTRPGVYSMPAEKVSILDALGMAGDLTSFSRRDNVLVIRETDGQRQFGRLDLTRTDIFESPYYYLRQNDLIIVDVTKYKSAETNQTTIRYVSIITSILSTVAIIISVLR